MLKKIVFFVLLSSACFGQSNREVIDSLSQSLAQNSEKQKALTLINLADEYSNFDLDKAILFANKSLKQATKIGNDSIKGLAYNAIANNFQYKTELDSALKYHQKALKIRIKINDSIGIADTYNNLGIFYETKSDYLKALSSYYKALFYYEKINKKAKQAMVCTNIGIVYKTQKAYKKAIIYYRKAYELYSKTTDNFGKTTSAGNLGSILINFKEYEESLKYSMIAKKGYEKLGYERFVGYPLSSIAYVYDSLHKYSIANVKYIECIGLHEKYENNFEIAEVAASYAKSLLKQSKPAESIIFSEKSLKHSKIAKAFLLEINNYKNLSEAYFKIGKFQEAYSLLKKFNKGSDSIFESEKTKTILELDTKYQTQKKENQILQQQAESKQKNIWLLLISSLAIIGLLLYRNQRVKSSQQRKQALLEKELLQEQTNVKIQEQRLDLSRELHDNIGSQLTFIISILDNLKNSSLKFDETISKKIDTVSSFTNKSIAELRDTIWALNSKDLSLSDLKIRIANFVKDASESVENTSFDFNFDIKNDYQLTSKQAINLFRILQETVNNALKHAQAKTIKISIIQAENNLKMSIADNGIGFDYEAKKKKSFGLTNIQNRVQELNATCEVQSNPNGTEFLIVMNC